MTPTIESLLTELADDHEVSLHDRKTTGKDLHQRWYGRLYHDGTGYEFEYVAYAPTLLGVLLKLRDGTAKEAAGGDTP